MPRMTGMELSKKIKPYLPNVKIIFITSHIKYAIDAFELSIFRYVPKSDLTNRLVSTVVDAAKLIELEGGKEYIIQIMKISDSMAYLKNGETLPISRFHLQEVKKQINRFWGAHI